MSDLIKKIGLILVEEGQSDYRKFKLGEIIKYSPSEVMDILRKHESELPSAQPELSNNSPKLDSENGELNDGDLISRKAAIDIVEKAFVRGLLATPDLRKLPSAQPEATRNNDCNGCKYVGYYDIDFPCASCVRKDQDYYESEG